MFWQRWGGRRIPLRIAVEFRSAEGQEDIVQLA